MVFAGNFIKTSTDFQHSFIDRFIGSAVSAQLMLAATRETGHATTAV